MNAIFFSVFNSIGNLPTNHAKQVYNVQLHSISAAGVLWRISNLGVLLDPTRDSFRENLISSSTNDINRYDPWKLPFHSRNNPFGQRHIELGQCIYFGKAMEIDRDNLAQGLVI